jgi:hypothetical protein
MKDVRNIVTRGQMWKSKDSKVVLEIVGKATGNRHWTCRSNNKKSHHIHEGTLQKFYELVTT